MSSSPPIDVLKVPEKLLSEDDTVDSLFDNIFNIYEADLTITQKKILGYWVQQNTSCV